MIINLRGTSGSGKSTLVRRLMELYTTRAKVHEKGRKQPLMYVCSRPDQPSLAVLGHYETACGGCDTINGYDRIYELVYRAHEMGYDVLYEGLLVSAEVTRAVELSKKPGVVLHVIHLDLPLETCLDSINARRRAKNPDAPPVDPKNTRSKHQGVRKCVERLTNAGVYTHVVEDRDRAFALARHLLQSGAVLPPGPGALPDEGAEVEGPAAPLDGGPGTA